MKSITVVDFIFAGLVIVGLAFAVNPFFTKQPSKTAMPAGAREPKILVTTLELSAKIVPPQKEKECAAEKVCNNSKLILADRELNSMKKKDVEETVVEAPVPISSGFEYFSDDDTYLSENVEQIELSEYPYGTPTPYSKQVVDAVITSVGGEKPLTREQVTQWQADLRDLIELGGDAVPAIWEYLNSFENTVFLPEDARSLGYPSSRIALLGALEQIGGDEAIELSVQMLQETAEPVEIAFLAKMLAEQQEISDEAREAAVAAAREVLDMAKAGEIETEGELDVGRLFEVLHKYGDDSVVTDLKQATTEWRYYAAIALANLPDGAGIPALIGMARGQNKVYSPVRSQALVMLAQVSTQSEEARNTLVEAARSNQIPEFYWHSIAASLSGATYRLETDVTGEGARASNASKNSSIHHIEGSNQNFVTDRSGVKDWSAEEIDERLILIDELLTVNWSPKGAELLQKSRSELEDRFDQLTSNPLNN